MRLILLLCACVAMLGCDPVDVRFGDEGGCTPDGCPYDVDLNRAPQLPPLRTQFSVDLPYELRVRNYKGGSCVHASTSMVLNHHGMYEQAEWWRNTYAYGEYASRLCSRVEQAGFKFAYTDDGDAAFLDWCTRTKRIATIFYKPAHSIVFIQYETRDGREVAKLLDNNRIDAYEWVEKQEFIRRWKGYGGFALTMVYSPPAPELWR